MTDNPKRLFVAALEALAPISDQHVSPVVTES